MNMYERYSAINNKLLRGERTFFTQIRGGSFTHYAPANYDRVVCYPKIGLYTGSGTSHSWLWFVEVFDRLGFYDITLLNEDHIKANCLDDIDVLAISGGDTFAIAEGLGEKGAKQLEKFIKEGGLYLGSCAGAYLALHSSKEHLNLFNYVPAKITNLAKILPEATKLKEKFCTPYGCSFIFHPVRDAVRLKTNGFAPFSGIQSLVAPLYGGPPMLAEGETQVLATYAGFTERTVFLVDEKLAQDTMLGKAAVIREKLGKGCLYLFGPHFEDPRFEMANELLAKAIYWDVRRDGVSGANDDIRGQFVAGKNLRRFLRDVKREISNSRIVAVGMETWPVRWTIGKKVYEPAKIRAFIEPIWNRIKFLEAMDTIFLMSEEDTSLVRRASKTTLLLRDIRQGVKQGADTETLAREMFKTLNKTCTLFLKIYFRAKLGHFGLKDHGWTH